MKHFFKQTLLLILLISVALPASLALYPKETKAQSTATCLAYYLGKKAQGIIGSVVGVNAVPTDSRTANKTLSQIEAQSQTQNFQDCILYPLVKILAKTLLQKFTSDIVEWINSGFEDGPGFVTNPEGFFREVGDRAAGSVIQQIAPALCGPFRIRLRIALGAHYSSYDEIGCTLSDVQENIHNAFVGGNFNAGGRGWQNWVAVTRSPGNNPIGAYLQAVNYTDRKVAKTVQFKDKEIGWANGFLSTRDCYDYEEVWVNPDDPSEGSTEGPCSSYGPIKTPGSTIEASLNQTLAQPLQDIGLAKSIDDILGALVGQAINQVFNATGLISGGSSSSRSSSGGYYTSPAYYSQLISSGSYSTGPSLPAGINQNICSTFNSSANYSVVGGTVRVTTISGSVATTLPALKSDGSPWTPAELNRVTQYCQAQPINTFVSGVIGSFASTTDNQVVPEPEFVTNLAFGEPASQISDLSGEFTANHAVDGSSYTNGSYAPAAITANQQNPWWQVTLPQMSRIDEVRIYRRAEAEVRYFDALGTFAVTIFDANQGTVWTSQNIDTSVSSTIPLVVPVNKVGKFVRIQRVEADSHSLQLAEVMVMGRKNATTTNATGGVALEPFALTLVPPVSDTFDLGATSLSKTINFTVSGSAEKQNIVIKMKFQKQTGPSSFSDTNFNSLLGGLSFQIKDLAVNCGAPGEPSCPSFTPVPIGGVNSATAKTDFAVTNGRRYNVALQFSSPYSNFSTYPCRDGHYRLLTDINAGNGDIWTHTTNIQVSDYTYFTGGGGFVGFGGFANSANTVSCSSNY